MGRNNTGKGTRIVTVQTGAQEMRRPLSKRISAHLADLQARKFQTLVAEGNDCFLKGQMMNALNAYTKALDIRSDHRVESSLGVTMLRLRLFEDAVNYLLLACTHDVEQKVAKGLPPCVSWSYAQRLCRARVRCGHHATAEEFTRDVLEQYKAHGMNCTEPLLMLEALKKWKAESERASYNIPELVKRRELYYEVGEFRGPVSNNRLDGIFAIGDIPKGTVIMGCKALAFVVQGKRIKMDDPVSREIEECLNFYLKDFPGGEATTDIVKDMCLLLNDLINFLKKNPMGKNACNVFGLPTVPNPQRRRTGQPPLKLQIQEDLKYLRNMVWTVMRNGVLRKVNLNTEKEESPGPEEIGQDAPVNALGVWDWLSHIRYTCVDANASVQFYGDFAIVRALKDIYVGEEISISYRITNLFEETNRLEDETPEPGCYCRLCIAIENEPTEVKEKRRVILEQAWTALKEGDMQEVDFCTLDLEELRNEQPDLNFPVFQWCLKIANYSLNLGMFRKAASYLERAYELTQCSFLLEYRLKLNIQICICYIQLEDEVKASRWGSFLRENLNTLYGSDRILPDIIRQEGMAVSESMMRELSHRISYEHTLASILNADPSMLAEEDLEPVYIWDDPASKIMRGLAYLSLNNIQVISPKFQNRNA